MSSDFTEHDAMGLLGSPVEARCETPNAACGELGEVVRADPYQERFTISVEWSGDDPPRFDEFTKGESQHFLNFKRRSTCL